MCKGLWRNGNASDYGSEDSRFDPWQARIFLFLLWASASEPAGSMPATQSQKREVGTIALWPHARAC